MTITEIAEAFSRHRFGDAYPHIADDARWVLVGEATIEGRDAIIAACDHTCGELAATTTAFSRFLSVTEGDAVAVDVIASYTDATGRTSVVSSCDIYQFVHGTLTMITSYAVELSPERPTLT